MNPRPSLLSLYVRSRGLPGAATALAVLLTANAWIAGWVIYRPLSERGSDVPFFVLLPILTAAITGTSLHSPSAELDHCAPLRWWRWRATHIVTATVVSACCLGLAAPNAAHGFGAQTAIRGVLGFTGLACAGAVLVGARLSWAPPMVYGLGVLLAVPRTPGGPATWWGWSMQSGSQPGAWATAAALFVGGAGLLIVRGPAVRR